MHQGSTLNVKAENHGNSKAYFTNFYSEDGFKTFLRTRNISTYITRSKPIDVAGEVEFNATTNPGDNMFVLFSSSEARIRVILNFNRTEYSTNYSNTLHCETHSYTKTSCKLPIPFGVGSVNGLLQVTYDGQELTDFEFEYLTVNTECNYRADSWTILWLPVMIVNIIIFTILLAFIKKVIYNEELRKIRAREHTVTPSSGMSTASAISDDPANSDEGAATIQLDSDAATSFHHAIAPVQVPTANSIEVTPPPIDTSGITPPLPIDTSGITALPTQTGITASPTRPPPATSNEATALPSRATSNKDTVSPAPPRQPPAVTSNVPTMHAALTSCLATTYSDASITPARPHVKVASTTIAEVYPTVEEDLHSAALVKQSHCYPDC